MKHLKKSIGALEAEFAVKLISLATDVAVMLDAEGVVKDISVTSEGMARDSAPSSWVGRRWIDTVTVESKPKIEQLLLDADSKQPGQWRQVNHPTSSGQSDLPVRYATMRIGKGGPIIAVGRELRSMSLLQQRLIEAQQGMEREYARVRFAETRYRLLFQISGEAVFVLDSTNLRVVEANPAAVRLLGQSAKRVIGKAFTELFEAGTQSGVQRSIDVLRSTGKSDDLTVRLAGSKSEYILSGSVFRQETSTHLLLRLAPLDGAVMEQPKSEAMLKTVIDRLPDAFVVTDLDRRILTGNAAFLELVQMVTQDQLRGESIDRWIGRSSSEINLLVGNLRDHRSVRNFETIVRGELGVTEDVEISAVAVKEGQQPCFGFTIRVAGQRSSMDAWDGRGLPRSVNQLTGLVGQVPLKGLVRETTDLSERMCIEAALEIVGDNRASAAEMLGLSRQSLYMKLRRYGLGDLGPD